jgi:hypothetical protein
VTVTVAVKAEVPVMLTDEGETVQDMLRYGFEQDRLTVPVKPASGVMVSVEVPDCPAERFMLDGFSDAL